MAPPGLRPPTSILGRPPCQVQELFDTGGPVLRMQRQPGGRGRRHGPRVGSGPDACGRPSLQWRHRAAASSLGPVWTLAQEAHLATSGPTWLPQLRAEGWSVVVCPGFAHESVPVSRWKLVIAPTLASCWAKEVDGPLATPAPVQKAHAGLSAKAPGCSAWASRSMGKPDLAPMLADLLRRDARWLQRAADGRHRRYRHHPLRAPGGNASTHPPGRSRPSWAPWWTC